MKTLLTLLLVFCTLLFVRCDNARIKTSNQKTTAYTINSPEYKSALAAELKAHPESFTYTLTGYLQQDNAEYLKIRIERNGFDKIENVLVNNWNTKLAGIHRTKGMGYIHSKLSGLKLDLVSNGKQQAFVYRDMDKVID